MTALIPSPCLAKEGCKNRGNYMIFLEYGKNSKQYSVKTLTICNKHYKWLGKLHQIILKDLEES